MGETQLESTWSYNVQFFLEINILTCQSYTHEKKTARIDCHCHCHCHCQNDQEWSPEQTRIMSRLAGDSAQWDWGITGSPCFNVSYYNYIYITLLYSYSLCPILLHTIAICLIMPYNALYHSSKPYSYPLSPCYGVHMSSANLYALPMSPRLYYAIQCFLPLIYAL